MSPMCTTTRRALFSKLRPDMPSRRGAPVWGERGKGTSLNFVLQSILELRLFEFLDVRSIACP